MISPRLAAAVFVQAIAFLGPLAAATAGLVGGELAGAAAPVVWFLAGVPLSYRVLDRRSRPEAAPDRRKVLRPVRL